MEWRRDYRTRLLPWSTVLSLGRVIPGTTGHRVPRCKQCSIKVYLSLQCNRAEFRIAVQFLPCFASRPFCSRSSSVRVLYLVEV
jgi:hypothetical protein